MKTLGQYSWKQLIRSWLLVEQRYPSLIKIVSASSPSPAPPESGVLFPECRSKHTGLSVLPLQRNLVNPQNARETSTVFKAS